MKWLLVLAVTVWAEPLPPCHQIPKVMCCNQRVLENCLSGCISYVTKKCPQKLEQYEDPEEKSQRQANHVTEKPSARKLAEQKNHYAEAKAEEKFIDVAELDAVRRAPSGGDKNLLNKDYPITEVSDLDLSSECGTVKSRPPYSPCLSRKTVDDLFLSCCQQHVPASCHSLCTYEHREHVAAETFISAVQQEGCDLRYLSNVLYCANQNRDNRDCCEYLGLANGELGVGDRCLRMCNVSPSGDRIGSVEKNDLVCISNWNVVMYCARSGLRTIN